MKLAVVSNLYPPLFIGGYEIGAALVVDELRRRGHDVRVLTAHRYYLQQPKGYLRRPHASTQGGQLLDAGPCVFGSGPGLLRRRPFSFVREALSSLLARRR